MTHEEAYEAPRGGIHLMIGPDRRRAVYGYLGRSSAPLCNTGDGHANVTDRLYQTTCKCCLALAKVHKIKAG